MYIIYLIDKNVNKKLIKQQFIHFFFIVSEFSSGKKLNFI